MCAACVFGLGPRDDNHFNQILMHLFRCIHSAFVVAGHSHGCSFPRWTLMMRLIISAFSYTLVFGVVCSCSNCSQVCPEVALWTSGYLIRENDATQWALIREKQTVCVWVNVRFALKTASSTQHSKYILLSGRWKCNLKHFCVLVVVSTERSCI